MGEFEQAVLLAILHLGADAYGMEVRTCIEERTGRDVSIGAVYTTLERLTRKGFISSRVGEPTAERGGRAKRFYAVEESGREALNDAQEFMSRMRSGVDLEVAGGGEAGSMRGPRRTRPPMLAEWILTRLAPRAMRDHLVGDLAQEFGARVQRGGRRLPAVRWYLGQVVRSVPHLLWERLSGGESPGSVWSLIDLKHALRSLRRSPTFTAVAVASLALGIGANAIVFTFVHDLLVAPLPVPQSDRLYAIEQVRGEGTASPWLSVPDVQDIRSSASTFQDVAMVTPDAFILQGAGDPAYEGGAEVSTNYFDLLGVRPLAGRFFEPQDDEAARIVISEGLWSRAYGRDPAAVGSVVDIDGRPCEIVGVAPDQADVLGDMAVWIPIRTSIAGWRHSRGTDWIYALGRLAPEVVDEAALAELGQLGQRLADAYPDTNEDQTFVAEALKTRLTGSIRTPLLVLQGAVALVLLIVAVNLAGLLLARAVARRREMATLVALGVGRARLFLRLLSESALLALVGGGLGVGIAVAGIPTLRGLLPPDLPGVADAGVHPPVLLFSAGLCLGATLIFGLVPALGAMRRDGGEVIAGRSPAGDRSHVLTRGGLVAGQIALALVLLVAASLLLRSFARLQGVELGFRTEGVMTARLPLVGAEFPSTGDRTRHYQAVLDGVREAPGVEAAAMINALPLRDGGPTFSFESDEVVGVDAKDRLAGFRTVLGDYFGVMDIEVVRGRTFDADELVGNAPAVVVDQAFERAFFPDGALGREIGVVDQVRPIVGVVASVADVSPGTPARPRMYVPLTADVRQTMAVVTWSRLAEGEALESLRQAVHGVDPGQTVQALQPLASYRRASVQRERLLLGILGVLGFLALLLAALGTYGILAYLVSRRSREIGVRMALGADRGSVRRMVLISSAKMVVVGLVVGTALAVVAGRFLRDFSSKSRPVIPSASERRRSPWPWRRWPRRYCRRSGRRGYRRWRRSGASEGSAPLSQRLVLEPRVALRECVLDLIRDGDAGGHVPGSRTPLGDHDLLHLADERIGLRFREAEVAGARDNRGTVGPARGLTAAPANLHGQEPLVVAPRDGGGQIVGR